MPDRPAKPRTSLPRGTYLRRALLAHHSTSPGSDVGAEVDDLLDDFPPIPDVMYRCKNKQCVAVNNRQHVHCACGEALTHYDAVCHFCQHDHNAHRARGTRFSAGCQVCKPRSFARRFQRF